jgi:tetraacyldisaccharide 4'-kinase
MALARPLAALAEKKITATQENRRRQRPPLPVVVVGNMVVGGAGKTPLTIALARALKEAGQKVGVIASGYGSPAYEFSDHAVVVRHKSRAKAVGDEPVLLAKATRLPVAVSGDRPSALRTLLKAYPALTVVLSDDGLQHTALNRSVELCVLDARLFGNGEVLPAGPLREPISGLAKVDALLLNSFADSPEVTARITAAAGAELPQLAQILAKPRFTFYFSELRFLPHAHWLTRENSKENIRAINAKELIDIAAGRAVAALASTAQPEAFFEGLRQLGMTVSAYPMADHAPFTREALRPITEPFVIMTEKDAVKWPLGRSQLVWVAVRDTQLDPRLLDWLTPLLIP